MWLRSSGHPSVTPSCLSPDTIIGYSPTQPQVHVFVTSSRHRSKNKSKTWREAGFVIAYDLQQLHGIKRRKCNLTTVDMTE